MIYYDEKAETRLETYTDTLVIEKDGDISYIIDFHVIELPLKNQEVESAAKNIILFENQGIGRSSNQDI